MERGIEFVMLYTIIVSILLIIFYFLPLLYLVEFNFGWLFTGFVVSFSVPISLMSSFNYTEVGLIFAAFLVFYSLCKKSTPFEVKDNLYNFNFDILPKVTFFIMMARLASMIATGLIIKGLELIHITDHTQQQVVQNISNSHTVGTTIMLFISACIVAPLTEEYAIRYVLNGYILKTKFKLHPIIAAIISCLVFASMHDSLAAIVNAFCTGLVLTWAYNKYGLWYSIWAHALFNLLAFIAVKTF
jgi:membrane protease YdiL (CAAX protease family)